MDTDTLFAPYIDKEYASFSAKLSKNHDLPYIGIRIPVLRKLAKNIDDFTFTIRYHEDVLFKGFWIASRKIPFAEKKELITKHLPLLSTWDEVDTLASSIKPGKTELEDVYQYFVSLLYDTRTMPRRLGIVTLMSLRKYYPEKKDEILTAITAADSDEYYISMAVAWALSFFIIDDKSASIFLGKVSPATQKRALQKLRDSRRY